MPALTATGGAVVAEPRTTGAGVVEPAVDGADDFAATGLDELLTAGELATGFCVVDDAGGVGVGVPAFAFAASVASCACNVETTLPSWVNSSLDASCLAALWIKVASQGF